MYAVHNLTQEAGTLLYTHLTKMKKTIVIDTPAYQLDVEIEWVEHIEAYRVRFTNTHLDNQPPQSHSEWFLTPEELIRLKVLAL